MIFLYKRNRRTHCKKQTVLYKELPKKYSYCTKALINKCIIDDKLSMT